MESKSSAPESSRRHSQRVIISIAVTVCNEAGDRDAAFREETRTLAVNTNGALIVLASKVKKTQLLRLKNHATQVEQICKVTYLGPVSEGKVQVGVEFATPSPEFWGIIFPPEDWISPKE